MGGRLRAFFDARFDTATAGELLDKQIHKRLPPHTSWLHVFGSLSLLLFISQTITGILLWSTIAPRPTRPTSRSSTSPPRCISAGCIDRSTPGAPP